ncbi:MAG: transketolase, partial [Sinobacteraceae bacterium]|nr:transketolase [Nevskiaceae bacterium]
LIPYGGTFLTFSDYARNAVRLSALMGCGSIFVYTHDSVGLGEDGPTHQPIEHIASLRLIPGLDIWRPADGFETAVAWRVAVERRDGPIALVLSRQNLTQQAHVVADAEKVARGGYVVFEPEQSAQALIIATGSEVGIAVEAAQALGGNDIPVRVVSMPCVEAFRRQDDAWREQVLPAAITARLAVEAGVTSGWHEFVGDHGDVLGIDRFGESAPGAQVMEMLGMTAAEVQRRVRGLLVG